MELRVPADRIAAVQLLVRTIAVSSGVLSPFIASMPAPYPYLILLVISTGGFMASSLLPKAGSHLAIVSKE